MKQIVLTLLVIVGALVAYAFWTYPSKPDGYDLSHHNKHIMWDKMDVKFVYLKATEGVRYVDPKYKEYSQEAKSRKILVGAYHFMRPNLSGQSQFEHFKAVVGRRTDLIPTLDIEVPNIKDKDILEWVNACEHFYGTKPIVYCRFSYHFKHRKALDGCKWWIACQYYINAAPDYLLWQYDIKDFQGVPIDHNSINPKYSIDDLTL